MMPSGKIEHGKPGSVRSGDARDIARPLRVAVTVAHRPNNPKETGGLAGTWEQISTVVSGRVDVELTVFFVGKPGEVREIAKNVRHERVPPAFASEWLPFLRAIPTHTDLAPLNPMLYRRLHGFDLIHTTDVLTPLRVPPISGPPGTVCP
jgi:hypothetical protein